MHEIVIVIDMTVFNSQMSGNCSKYFSNLKKPQKIIITGFSYSVVCRPTGIKYACIAVKFYFTYSILFTYFYISHKCIAHNNSKATTAAAAAAAAAINAEDANHTEACHLSQNVCSVHVKLLLYYVNRRIRVLGVPRVDT